MVEHIESIHAELCVQPLRHLEVLHQRQVRGKRARAGHDVAAGRSQASYPRIEPSSTQGLRGEEGHPVVDRIEGAGAGLEAALATVWPADTDVLFVSAYRRARGPGQAAAPVGGGTQLPAPDDGVEGPAGVGGKALSSPEGQLVNGIENEHV